MTPLIRRLGTGFLTAGVSLTALTTLAGAPAQAATNAAADAAATGAGRTAAPAGDDIWFLDPLSAATRRAEVAVPSRPERLEGRKLTWTKARLRTHAGKLAVPAAQAVGHSMVSGQAVTITGEPFGYGSSKLTSTGRQQIARLADSLTGVSAVRCEGYADYTKHTSHTNVPLSKRRAKAVCDALEAQHPGLVTTTAGYGGTRPVILGRETNKRVANRRVVVAATSNNTGPNAPVLTSAAFGNGSALLSFAKPTAPGSSPVTGYEYSTDDGAAWHSLTTSGSGPLTATVTGLTNGVEYPFTVRAVSQVWSSEASNVVKVTPATVPGKVDLGDGMGVGDGSLKLFFEPVAGNGRTVSKYEYSVDDGAWTTFVPSGSSLLSTTITGLTNGTPYTVKVRAHNAVGDGAASAPLTAKPGAVPAAVSLDPGSVDAGDKSATVAFSAPDDKGRAITGYEYTVDGGANWVTLPVTGSNPLEGTITGLSNGTAYTVKVRALNALGEGEASNGRSVTPAAASRTAPVIENTSHVVGSYGLRHAELDLTLEATPELQDLEVSTDGGTNWTPLTYGYQGGDKFEGYVSFNDGICGGGDTDVNYLVRGVYTDGAGDPSASFKLTFPDGCPD